MSVLAAAVTLAWGCLTVLTLAMAGMLRQLRELQVKVAQLRAEQGTRPWRATTGRRIPQLAGVGHLVLLVLDPGCSLCDMVHEPFTRLSGEHPGIRFEVLSPRARWAGSPGIRSRVDAELFAELDLSWAPALLHVGADGTVLSADPVTTPEQIGEQVAVLVNSDRTQQGAR